VRVARTASDPADRTEARLRELDRKSAGLAAASGNLPQGRVAWTRWAGSSITGAGGVTLWLVQLSTPVRAGRCYDISVQFPAYVNGSAASFGDMYINLTTDGSPPAPGVNAQLLHNSVVAIPIGGGIPCLQVARQSYMPAVDATIRVLLSARMADSARTYGIQSDPANGVFIAMWVDDLGVASADAGVTA
jgi:hypothetical protein